MKWTDLQLAVDLPKIRKLRGVQTAFATDEYVYIRTKAWKLKGLGSILPMPRFDIRIARDYYHPAIKYVVPLAKFFHWHPTINKKVHAHKFYHPCWGTAGRDFEMAYRSGPYVYAIVVLTTLQTIRSEYRSDWQDDWALWTLVGFMALVTCPVWALILFR